MIFQRFKELWLSYNQIINLKYNPPDNVVSVAFEILGMYPEDLLVAALKMVVSESKYQIMVSDVVSKLKEIGGLSETSVEITAGKEYEKITKALLTWGFHRNILCEDPITTAVIESFGGLESFYENEFNVFLKKEFIKYYLECSKTKQEHKVLKISGSNSFTDTVLISRDYQPGINSAIHLTEEQAQKMVDNADLIGAKVDYIRRQELLRLENMPPEDRDTTPADPEQVAEAFEKFVNAFSGKKIKGELFSKTIWKKFNFRILLIYTYNRDSSFQFLFVVYNKETEW
jgi:hypothetical protein